MKKILNNLIEVRKTFGFSAQTPSFYPKLTVEENLLIVLEHLNGIKKSEYKKNVFRCPFCFFLISISRSAMKMFENLDKDSQEIEIIEESNLKESKMIEIENIDQINASCSYCYNIFLGEFKVFKCENCGSFYHEPCLQKMYTELKACRFCGAKIINL